jgi:hypothetical protein
VVVAVAAAAVVAVVAAAVAEMPMRSAIKKQSPGPQERHRLASSTDRVWFHPRRPVLFGLTCRPGSGLACPCLVLYC